MKKSMQVTAIAAFFGCFAILALAAGEKAEKQEKCGEEWNGPEKAQSSPVKEKAAKQAEKEVAIHWNDHWEELIFPVQLFHQII